MNTFTRYFIAPVRLSNNSFFFMWLNSNETFISQTLSFIAIQPE